MPKQPSISDGQWTPLLQGVSEGQRHFPEQRRRLRRFEAEDRFQPRVLPGRDVHCLSGSEQGLQHCTRCHKKLVFFLRENYFVLDICKPEPSIHPSTDEAAVTYAGSTTVLGPQKFLTFLQCEVAGSQSYYVARNSATNVAVVIDLGCQVISNFSKMAF